MKNINKYYPKVKRKSHYITKRNRGPKGVVTNRDYKDLVEFLSVRSSRAIVKVLRLLIFHKEETNWQEVRPSYQYLARKADISPRQVGRIMKQLEDRGLIRIQRRYWDTSIFNLGTMWNDATFRQMVSLVFPHLKAIYLGLLLSISAVYEHNDIFTAKDTYNRADVLLNKIGEYIISSYDESRARNEALSQFLSEVRGRYGGVSSRSIKGVTCVNENQLKQEDVMSQGYSYMQFCNENKDKLTRNTEAEKRMLYEHECKRRERNNNPTTQTPSKSLFEL